LTASKIKVRDSYKLQEVTRIDKKNY